MNSIWNLFIVWIYMVLALRMPSSAAGGVAQQAACRQVSSDGECPLPRSTLIYHFVSLLVSLFNMTGGRRALIALVALAVGCAAATPDPKRVTIYGNDLLICVQFSGRTGLACIRPAAAKGGLRHSAMSCVLSTLVQQARPCSWRQSTEGARKGEWIVWPACRQRTLRASLPGKG